MLNTHWHDDHTGGNENLGKAGAIIVAHHNVRKRMSTEQLIDFLNLKTKADPKDALPVAAQQDFSRVEVKAVKINDTTYMLAGAGGNIGLSVGEDAAFIVDDQFAPLTARITAAIAQITPKPV